MDKELSTSEIRREADAHIELGMLLRRPRSEEDKKSVEKLLHSRLSIDEIIREIKKLDRRAEEQKASREEESAPAEIQKKEDDAVRQQPLRHRMSVMRSVIKMPFKPYSYLLFLFRELKKIRAFGHRTHIFESVFFPPNVKLREGLKRYFAKELLTNVSTLSAMVGQAVELGWYYLDKRDYNLLVVLGELCKRLMDVRFDTLDMKDRNLIEKLRSVETLFYVVHYRESYPEVILSSLHKVLDRDPRYQGEKEEISTVARRILYPDVMLPSFFNFLLGLNMLKYRRYLTAGDLICRDLGEIINSMEFGCTGSVRKRIDEFIEESKEQLVQSIEQHKETKHLQDYLPVTKTGELDFGLLMRFYEGSAIVNADHDFKADQENMMLFTPRFMRAFENILFPLLCGRIVTEDGAKVRIFDRSFFPVEFPKIRQISTKLDKMAFNYRIFPRKRYFQIKDNTKGGIPVELEAINLIDEAVAIILEIGRKLEKLIRTLQNVETPEPVTEPLGPIALQGRAAGIPHEEKKISSRSILNGMTLRESLGFAASVCFTLAAYFQNLEKVDVFANLERLDLKIRSQLDVLERVADAVTFQELESLFVQSLR